jgi:hypothetical protein
MAAGSNEGKRLAARGGRRWRRVKSVGEGVRDDGG